MNYTKTHCNTILGKNFQTKTKYKDITAGMRLMIESNNDKSSMARN